MKMCCYFITFIFFIKSNRMDSQSRHGVSRILRKVTSTLIRCPRVRTVDSSNLCLHHLFAARIEHLHLMVLRPRDDNFSLSELKSEFAR